MFNIFDFKKNKIFTRVACCTSYDDTIVSNDDIIEFDNISYTNTIPFVAPISSGKVVKIYDGDTITIASKLPYNESPMYRFSVRLNGIDCPEIKGKTEDEKECAELAKQELTKLLMGNIVELKNLQTEKYGRVLADVYINGLNVNNHMIERRLAVKYDGGTKQIPNSWLQYYIKGEM